MTDSNNSLNQVSKLVGMGLIPIMFVPASLLGQLFNPKDLMLQKDAYLPSKPVSPKLSVKVTQAQAKLVKPVDNEKLASKSKLLTLDSIGNKAQDKVNYSIYAISPKARRVIKTLHAHLVSGNNVVDAGRLRVDSLGKETRAVWMYTIAMLIRRGAVFNLGKKRTSKYQLNMENELTKAVLANA